MPNHALLFCKGSNSIRALILSYHLSVQSKQTSDSLSNVLMLHKPVTCCILQNIKFGSIIPSPDQLLVKRVGHVTTYTLFCLLFYITE